MRRHDSSSGEMEDATDNTPAVDSANEESVAKAKARHVKIPPPNHVSNGIKGSSISPQPAAGKQSRPQSANRGSAAPVRYFILKSYNRENVERSIDQGVWSTQKHNEQKLCEAFEHSKDVFLIFSVNMSGHFQGYARMISTSNSRQGDQGQWEGTQNLGSCFELEWRRLYDLPFSETEFLKNPLNEDKPVKISRDGQELPPDIGQELVRLFEEGAERHGVPRPARVRVPPQGPPAPGRTNGQGMMGRGNGRGAGPGRGRGGPEMMGGPVNMPTPFFGDMSGMPMNGMGGMGPMGPYPMMAGMDLNYGRMGGFEEGFGMPGLASMGMGMNPMGHPMMAGMGDMGFPMVMPPRPPPPPRRQPVDESLNRLGPAPRPYSSDRMYDDDHVDDYRDPPARSGYSRDGRQRDGPSGSEYGRSARSPPPGYDSRDRRHRGRERSASPHRRGRTSSRRHSRSRSRTRSRERRTRPNFLDMDYGDYRKNFREVRDSRARSSRAKERSSDRDRASAPAASSGAGWGLMSPNMMGMNPMMGMLDEDAVVAMYAQAYRQINQRFDPQRCRVWFRELKEKMNMNTMSMGMGMGVPGMGRMMGMPGMG